MSEALTFPQVVVHNGQVDAGPNIIAINTRDQIISRNGRHVSYGHGRPLDSKAFLLAKAMLLAHPRHLSSKQLLVALYGPSEAGWPRDHTKAVGQPMSDLRHRAGKRLGLVVEKAGASYFRLAVAQPTQPIAEEIHARRVAQGRATPGRPGVRQFGVEFDDVEARTIRAFAVAENTSFAEAVRTLVTWGLESAGKEEAA